MKKLVIIPTYNEKENIENIISAVFALEDDFHILVVDDSSPDGTADLVNLRKISHYLHLSVRKVKMVWEKHIFMVLNGQSKTSMIIFSKWMPIFLTTRMIFLNFMKPV
jgi:glycosyltransferase involved in cell wall biosynthesis